MQFKSSEAVMEVRMSTEGFEQAMESGGDGGDNSGLIWPMLFG